LIALEKARWLRRRAPGSTLWTGFDPEGLYTEAEYDQQISQQTHEMDEAEAQAKKLGATDQDLAEVRKPYEDKIGYDKAQEGHIEETARHINELAGREIVDETKLDDGEGKAAGAGKFYEGLQGINDTADLFYAVQGTGLLVAETGLLDSGGALIAKGVQAFRAAFGAKVAADGASAVRDGALLPKRCFAAGTKVSTPDGERNIEDIKKGDVVYAYDLRSKQVGRSEVLETVQNFTYHWADVQVGDETIHATRTHKFWVQSQKQWVEAARLHAGMSVLLEDGKTETIEAVTVRDLAKPDKTYNFVVKDEHDYFVGTHQLLVHNGLPGPSDVPPASGQFDNDHRYSQSAFPELKNDKSLQTGLDSTMNRGWRQEKQTQLMKEEQEMIEKVMTPQEARAATQGEWNALANSVDDYPSGQVTTGEYSGVQEGPPCD
jgi:hypothetical protein